MRVAQSPNDRETDDCDAMVVTNCRPTRNDHSTSNIRYLYKYENNQQSSVVGERMRMTATVRCQGQ